MIITDPSKIGRVIPRGLRNNNPLNIRRSRSQWLGKVPHSKSSDTQFEQFDTIEHGLRAAMCLLRTYINKYKLQSVSSIIHRWAPVSDGNDVLFYTQYVLNELVTNRCNPYYFKATPVVIVNLVRAMAKVESSKDFSHAYLFKIYYQYFKH